MAEMQSQAGVLDLSSYDEMEDGTVLRTLVDWKLINQDNELATLDELGEGKPFCTVTGYVIKPLPVNVKTTVCENLCTYGASKPGEREMVTVQEQLIKDHVDVEWEDLKVGDYLDGYW